MTDLSNIRTFMNWALYGLTATISTVSGVAYYNIQNQLKACQEENRYYARESFNAALKIKVQEETIQIQDTAITEATKHYEKATINKPIRIGRD